MRTPGGFSDRIAACRQLGARRGCSHVLITDPVDVAYLTGFRASSAHCVVSAQRVTIISDFRYQESLQDFCARNPACSCIIGKQNAFTYFGELRPKVRTLGIQSDILTLDQFDALKRQARACRFVKLGSAVTDLSIPKTAPEIACMRRAAAIGAKALAAWLPLLRADVSEAAAARKLEQLCAEYGSEKPSFDTIVLFGTRSSLVHGVPGRARLRRGDWVLIDFGCVVQGFCSDMTRTIVFGRAGRRQKELYAIVAKAQRQARAVVRAGATTGAIDAAARTVIDGAGYKDQFGHATGHGVGLRIHENPRLARDERFILPEGAVVTVEPGIYIKDFGGCRIEDMLVTTASGARILTGFPHTLIEVLP